MDFATDLSFFYADYGILAHHVPRAGSAPADGLVLFNQPGISLIGSDVIATDLSIQYPATTFPVVRQGDAFTIAGQSYVAREPHQPTADGAEFTVPLKKA